MGDDRGGVGVKVEIRIETTRGEVTIVQHQTVRLGKPTRSRKQVLDAAVADARSWLNRNPEPELMRAPGEER